MDRCPVCGTIGRMWNKEPQVFVCPNCSAFYSKFGMVIESRAKDITPYWS